MKVYSGPGKMVGRMMDKASLYFDDSKGKKP